MDHVPECPGSNGPDYRYFGPCICDLLAACALRVATEASDFSVPYWEHKVREARDAGFRDGLQAARTETARQLGLLFAKAASDGWSYIPEGSVIAAAMGGKW